MSRTATALVILAATTAAHAEDLVPRTVPPPAVATSPAPTPVPGKAGTSWLELRVGFEGGGAPFLRPPEGPVAMTTAETSSSLFARISLPVITSRTFEVSWIPHHGASLLLQSGDIHIGPLSLHLLDLGAFYATEQPVTVSRVQRRWDAVLGAGAELAVMRHLSLVVDARMFVPVDLWSVVTRYADTARLIGEELVHGAQVWAGAAYRW